MGFHTFDPAEVDRLEDPTRFRFCSREELLEGLELGETEILDLGSGSGFYTDEIAPFLGRVYAVDVQPAMHGHYRDRGVPDTVTPVTATAQNLPFGDGRLDGAVSVMTFHESTTDAAMAELFRVLAAGAPVVVVDWSRNGRGEAGPPLGERYDATTAREFFERAGFTVERCRERSETMRVLARR